MLRVVELFGGIGACTAALNRLGIEHEVVDYVEIDKYACASYNVINGTHFEPQDICTWDKDIDCDLIMHGSPCQDFSVAGQQAGGDEGSGTRSSLMYETLRIVAKLKPKYVIWENVKNLLSKKHRHNFDKYLDKMAELGYQNFYQVLNAKDYGIPQNRERVFTISILGGGEFKFPEKEELKLRLKDMLEEQVDEKYYLSQQHVARILNWKSFQNPLDKVYGENSVVDTITTRVAESDGGGISASAKFVNENEMDTMNFRKEKGASYLRSFGSKGKLQDKEVSDTIVASMGTGGGNVPIIKVKNATKQIDGNMDVAAIGELTTQNKRIKSLAEKIDTSKETQFMDIYNQKNMELCGTLKSGMDYQQGNIIYNDLRIRKLTPKECWRLMGFKDEEFEKAAKVNSNSQLYKQAGNSIVVNVLEGILKNLLEE